MGIFKSMIEFKWPILLFEVIFLIGVCGKINLHTIAAQKYITPQAA